MSKSITLTPSQWEQLKIQLQKDYSPSVLLIRSKMRNVLGFVDREHREYIGDFKGGYRYVVNLDFYNEPKRLMFLLKYTEYINKNNIGVD